MVTVPAFVTVGLVQKLCRALQQAHEQGLTAPGELTLEAVQVGFDGRVRPTAFGEARHDVRAAALILDQLLGETVDPELIRIIGEARLGDPVITTALALEQRLAHWQVKQHQLFPGHDLTGALARWLCPEQSPAAPDEAVKEWLESQCTGPIVDEPELPRRKALSTPSNWRRLAWVGAGLMFLIGMALAAFSMSLRYQPQEHDPVASITAARVAEPIAELPKPAPLAVVTEVQDSQAPRFPRSASGAPIKLQLSSRVHGVRLEASGFEVSAPWKHWAVKVVPTRGQKRAPTYGSLFVAELGDQKVARLSRVGPEGWQQLHSRDARFFLMQTDLPPGEGSFSLAIGEPGKGETKVTELREGVLTDAMTQVEDSRFLLDGLEPGQTYEVIQHPTTKEGGPPVVAIGTLASMNSRALKGAGFNQTGSPLDQVLLSPGVPVKVSGVSRLSFVVLTTDDAPERLASIEVVPRGPAPLTKKGKGSEDYETCRTYAPPGFDCNDVERLGQKGP